VHRTLLITCVLLTACASSAASGSSSSRPSSSATVLAANATVISVTDGDTIDVRVDGRPEAVRLLGIDTPEVKDPRKPVQCFGQEASAYTHRLLPKGTILHLERDVEPRDQYGRLLAYAYRAADGLFVNLELARLGYAGLLTYPPNTAHEPALRTAVDEARQAGRGLWSACGGLGVPASR
jgi:micrococcal nuclease